jgi:uncharacterized protein (TIRG00374 family)
LINKTLLLRTVFGLTLLAGLIWYFDPQQIILSLSAVNIFWVAMAALLIIATTLLGAVNLHLLINLEKNISFTSFLPLFWISWAIGLLVPGQIGDMASIAAQLHRRGIKLSTSVGRSVVDKLISLILMCIFAFWGFTLLLPLSISIAWVCGTIFILALGLWLFKRIVSWISTKTGKLAQFIVNTLRETAQVIVQQPQRISANTFLTIIKIIMTGFSYWCVFLALGYNNIDPFGVIALVAISSLTAYIPISFNGIGTAEVVGVLMFETLGMIQADILTAYLILRGLVILIAWLPAGLWLLLAQQRPH